MNVSASTWRFFGWMFRCIAALTLVGFAMEVGRRQGGAAPRVNLVGQASMVVVWLYVASLHFRLANTRPGSCRFRGCIAVHGHRGRHVVTSSDYEWWLR